MSAILLIIVGAAGFFGGMQYQKMQKGRPGQFSAPNGQMRRLGQNGTGRPIAGQIISTDDKSITVKLQDGSSKIVLLSGTTSITEATSSSKQALQTGKQVAVFGSDNADGSVTAGNIQLNPMFRANFGQQR